MVQICVMFRIMLYAVLRHRLMLHLGGSARRWAAILTDAEDEGWAAEDHPIDLQVPFDHLEGPKHYLLDPGHYLLGQEMRLPWMLLPFDRRGHRAMVEIDPRDPRGLDKEAAADRIDRHVQTALTKTMPNDL